jgi:hypothetical protein
MSITSPAEFLENLDVEFFKRYRSMPDADLAPVEYVEPDLGSSSTHSKSTTAPTLDPGNGGANASKMLDKITSKIVTLGDFIDTDAVCYPT